MRLVGRVAGHEGDIVHILPGQAFDVGKAKVLIKGKAVRVTIDKKTFAFPVDLA
jgi:hypothetical protein